MPRACAAAALLAVTRVCSGFQKRGRRLPTSSREGMPSCFQVIQISASADVRRTSISTVRGPDAAARVIASRVFSIASTGSPRWATNSGG